MASKMDLRKTLTVVAHIVLRVQLVQMVFKMATRKVLIVEASIVQTVVSSMMKYLPTFNLPILGENI